MSDAITSEAPRTAAARIRFLKTDTGHPSTGRLPERNKGTPSMAERSLRGSVGARPEHLTCWTSCSQGGGGAIHVFSGLCVANAQSSDKFRSGQRWHAFVAHQPALGKSTLQGPTPRSWVKSAER